MLVSAQAAFDGKPDLALGNALGSNMFNLLAVPGIAGFIAPMSHINPDVLLRDWPTVMVLTAGLLFMAYGHGRQGKISRIDGSILLISFFAYNAYLISTLVN
jgi:cation:H+ antiporter